MNEPRQRYLEKVASSLEGCQLLELELKLYLDKAFEVIRRSVKGVIAFRHTGKDCENHSLERLISEFRKVSSNDELIFNLVKFKDERNFLAHRAIINCSDQEGVFDDSNADYPRLEAIHREADRLCAAVYEEYTKFAYYYEFGDIENGRLPKNRINNE